MKQKTHQIYRLSLTEGCDIDDILEQKQLSYHFEMSILHCIHDILVRVFVFFFSCDVLAIVLHCIVPLHTSRA